MKVVVFRVDGSLQLGMGHIMRCCAFAERLRELDVKSVFLTKECESQIEDVIRASGFYLETMQHNFSAKEDVNYTKSLADHYSAGMIVTDICHTQALGHLEEFLQYHHYLSRDIFTLCIAGGTLVNVPCHLVLSPYFRIDYPEICSNGFPDVLLGQSYFIFRRQFIEIAKLNRNIDRNAGKLLITIGGSDDLGFTPKIVKSIVMLPNKDLQLKIVIGPGFPKGTKHELDRLLGNYNGEHIFLTNTSDLAREMFWADLAITGDGLTKYETAVTGTPSIMISRFDSEHELNRQFSQTGVNLYAGDGALIAVESLSMTIADLLYDHGSRQHMSQTGKKIMDGKGLERIIEKIPRGFLQ
jgi:UDP-2,4-diacetamido-2,4,6-trideoxy-beta-L-altropyranose hydrolase